MKPIKTLVTVIIICCISMGFAPPDDWYLFEGPGYSMTFPKKPTESTQSVPTAIGELEMELFMYEGATDGDDNFLYGLITSVYPDSLVNSGKVELLPEFFRRSIDGAVANVKGKLLSEKNITIGGFPGREVRVDYQQGLAVIKMRVYLIHNKLFLIQTITATEKEGNQGVSRFHDSFRLSK
jgi:hypothetical protein